jgi:hypothetical protein
MFDRTFDRSFDPITINRTNSLGSIKCSIEHLILSRSIELIHYARSIDRILNRTFDRSFDSITINQTNSRGSIGCSIEHLINHLILSRSIELIH